MPARPVIRARIAPVRWPSPCLGRGHAIEQLSLEDGASARDFGARIADRFGKVHVLVNSAGFTQPAPHGDLDAMTDELLDSVLIANVRGPFSVIRALAPAMRASGDAVVVNVSSITGLGSSVA